MRGSGARGSEPTGKAVPRSGMRHREDQRAWQSNLENEIVRLREGVMRLDYRIGNCRRFTICEPKEREICAASFGERVLHHISHAWAIPAMIEIFA